MRVLLIALLAAISYAQTEMESCCFEVMKVLIERIFKIGNFSRQTSTLKNKAANGVM